MRTHDVKCNPNIAKRLGRLGRVAIGYPLPNGSWSIGGNGFRDGETIMLRFQSKHGAKLYMTATATVVDQRDPSGNGCFVATFPSING